MRTILHKAGARAWLVGLIVVVAGAVMVPAAGAATVIADTTINNLQLSPGAHDLEYDNVHFTGGSATRAVVQIDSGAYRLTFRNCTIASGPWNGITISPTTAQALMK